MSAKHTPGPWAWDDGFDHKPDRKVDLYGKDNVTVLEYAGCGSHELTGKPEDLALIAAAPDLLAALSDALTWMDFVDKERDPGLTERIRRARAAIVKAGAPVPIFKIRGGAR